MKCAYRLRDLMLIVTFIGTTVCGKSGYGPGEQDWGYIDVRPGAHMFYWLYYTTADVVHYTERPLVIWLQGGPGSSSTGYGNFEELGPLDLYGDPRNWTWVKDMNVLFIDNPVGSGFSYADNIEVLATSNKEIANDLVTFMKSFYGLHPEFEEVPLHIFCQSYGGKMSPEFALELYYAQQRRELKSNLTSVALGSPWASPIDSILAWAPLLLNMGIVDRFGYENIMDSANKTLQFVQQEMWTEATAQWAHTSFIASNESKGVDFYNFVKPVKKAVYTRMISSSNNNRGEGYDRDEILKDLMTGPVSEALDIPPNVEWASQRLSTFAQLKGDFMKPVIHIVEELLDKTNLKVGVFSGQFDLICATPGTVNWINKLRWSHRDEYVTAPRLPIRVNDVLEGYEKIGGKFSMFWINRAGHMAPAENPAAMSYILKKFTSFG